MEHTPGAEEDEYYDDYVRVLILVLMEHTLGEHFLQRHVYQGDVAIFIHALTFQ